MGFKSWLGVMAVGTALEKLGSYMEENDSFPAIFSSKEEPAPVKAKKPERGTPQNKEDWWALYDVVSALDVQILMLEYECGKINKTPEALQTIAQKKRYVQNRVRIAKISKEVVRYRRLLEESDCWDL